MEITCKAFLQKEWTLLNDRIVVGGKTILLSSIIKVTHTPHQKDNSVIQVFYGSGAFDFATLAYPPKQREDGEKAYAYISEIINSRKTEQNTVKQESFRKICSVCGHIFCYTTEDLERNKRLKSAADTNSKLGTFNSIFGSMYQGTELSKTAEQQRRQIIDYSKCPNCGSKDISDATDEDIARNKNKNAGNAPVSSADELKKFKELLDAGIITQEEFDAKKKQLLGL